MKAPLLHSTSTFRTFCAAGAVAARPRRQPRSPWRSRRPPLRPRRQPPPSGGCEARWRSRVPGAPWPRRRRPLRPAAAPRARHPALAAACLVAAATGRAAFLRLPAAPLRPCRRAMAAGAAALLAGELLAGCGGACVAAAAVQLEMPGGSNDCPDCTISGAPGLASVGAGPEAERGWGDRVSRLVSQNRVMVFSKSWCPYCARAKGALAEESWAENRSVSTEFGPRGRGHGYVRRS
ncbi:unnamed protein product [Prorocentrum cordatum]|uniref:Glutaredoxin domain-containing protein n=1 Tax=Prorocentrum cordatum TaxID=2364126 RepID=A0ABN9QJB3_9DINO|nr:unnamed protein product [Polarella glacialis]